MEGDKADVTSLLNHLETQLQLQDTLIFKLQEEQSARQSWQVRHGSFNDPTNNHHPMHASLNASINENYQKDFFPNSSKNDFKEREKVKCKLSQQQDMLKNDTCYKRNDLSQSERNQFCQHNSNDPMCYLQKLIHSQHFARCNYSQQLQKYSLAYYKGMRRRESVVKECKREMDENDITIYDTLHQRNCIRDELIILQKKNQKLKSQIEVLKNASEKELRTKKIISKLLNRRSDIENRLKKHCQAIFTKESKLTESKEKSDLLTKNLIKKREETEHAVGLLEGMFMREMAEQRDEMKDKKESLKCLETTNLKLIQQINTKHHPPQSSSHGLASVNSTPTSSSLTPNNSQALFSDPPSIYAPFDSTNTIKPAHNHLNHHLSKNTTKKSQFHNQFPINTTPTSLISYFSVSTAADTLTADTLTADTLVADTLTADTLETDTLATNTLVRDNTDIQCVIERMQETLIMMEKGFSDEGDNKSDNRIDTHGDNIFGSIQLDDDSQIFSRNVSACITSLPCQPSTQSFINTTPNKSLISSPPSPNYTTPHATTPHATTSYYTTLHSTTPHSITSHYTTPHLTTPYSSTPHSITSHSTTPHFPSIFKSSIRPLSTNSQHKSNDRSFFNAPFIPSTLSPNKPHPFTSKPSRLITISSPLKPPTHLLPPTKSSS